MSHLRKSRATLTREKGLRVKVASVAGRVARLVFGIERCSILCDFDARQSRASKKRDKIAGVTSALLCPALWKLCDAISLTCPVI